MGLLEMGFPGVEPVEGRSFQEGGTSSSYWAVQVSQLGLQIVGELGQPDFRQDFISFVRVVWGR
jgi:hypothetical protein